MGIKDALKKAGKKIKEYVEILNDTSETPKTPMQELSGLIYQISEIKNEQQDANVTKIGNLLISVLEGLINKRKSGEPDLKEENFIKITKGIIFPYTTDELLFDYDGYIRYDDYEKPKTKQKTHYSLRTPSPSLYDSIRAFDKKLNGNNAYKIENDIDDENAKLL